MKLTITAEHVNKGIPNNSTACPTALALQDLNYPAVSVGTYTGCVYKDEYSAPIKKFKWSTELIEQICNLDTGRKFLPGDYEITEISLDEDVKL